MKSAMTRCAELADVEDNDDAIRRQDVDLKRTSADLAYQRAV
jgi:hypothetical protein